MMMGGDFMVWLVFITWLVWLGVGLLLCAWLWKKVTKE